MIGEIGYLFQLVLVYPVFNALIVLDHLFGDFGLAIVVLTLVIKLILFPLTLQQLKSTKATQALQPEMAKIREKYKNDQQAQAQAMQALYKEYGVNPMAGCLPLVIQLPVLYGLYFALREGLSFSTLDKLHASVYPFVRPLITSLPDPSFTWFSWLHFLNPILHVSWTWTFPLTAADPTHILPVLAGLATFLSLRMSQPRTAPTPSDGKSSAVDATQQSMKMMQYIMPVFTAVIGWNIASGLALYWVISSLFQAVQQYFVTGLGGLQPAAAPQKAVKPASASTKSSSTATPAPKKVVDSSLATTSSADKPKSTSNVQNVQARPVSAAAGATGGTMDANGSSGSQYNRRQRSNSASARRRNASRARR